MNDPVSRPTVPRSDLMPAGDRPQADTSGPFSSTAGKSALGV